MGRRPDLGFYENEIDFQDAKVWEANILPREKAQKIEPLVYSSLTFSQLENEAIWTRDWVFVGIIDDIPNEGDLLPYTNGNHGIHIQNMGDGKLEGRFNNAQHGGCRVVPLQCQQGTKTKCSFTSCGYSRDRKAISASDRQTSEVLMYQYVGLRPERLFRISVEQIGKLIFANVDGPEKTLDKCAVNSAENTIPETLAKRENQKWYEFNCNWKLVMPTLFGQSESQQNADIQSFYANLTLPESSNGDPSIKATYLYPNMIILALGSIICVIAVQPTALEKTKLRAHFFAKNSDPIIEGDIEFLQGFIQTVGDHAERSQKCVNLQILKLSEDAPTDENILNGALQASLSEAEYWMQATLIDRIMNMPSNDIKTPMFSTLNNYKI